MNERQAVLEAIAFGDDPKITPTIGCGPWMASANSGEKRPMTQSSLKTRFGRRLIVGTR